MADLAQLQAQLILDVGNFDREVRAVNDAINAVVRNLNDMAQQQQNAQAGANQNTQATQDLQNALDQLAQAQRDAANASQDLGGSLNGAQGGMDDLNNSTRRAQQDLDSANGSANELGFVIGSTLRNAVIGAAGAFLSFKTAQAAIAAVTAEAQRASDIYNKAFQLNVDTDSLQGFYFAAEKVGLSAENINDIFKDVNDKMGDFSLNGSGEISDFAESLGIDLTKLIGLSPDKVILQISEAASKLSTQERANIFEAMGNDLDFMKPLLTENALLLDENIQKAKDFGLVLSGADVTAYHDFNNTLTDIGGRLEGMRRQVLAGLAEPFAEATGFVNQWIESLGGGEKLANDISNALVTGLQMAVEAAAWLGKAFYALKPVLDVLATSVALIARGFVEVIELATKLPASISPIAAFNNENGGIVVAGTTAAKKVLDNYLQDAKTIEESFKHSAKSIEEIDAFRNGFNSSLEKGRQASNERLQAKVELPALESKVAELSKALKSAQDSVDEQRNGQNGSTEQLTEALNNLAVVEKAQKEAVAALAAAQKLTGSIEARDDGGVSRTNAAMRASAEEQEIYQGERKKELEKAQKELLKTQEEQLRWKQKLDMDDAKKADEAAKIQQDASTKMQSAVRDFDSSVKDSKKSVKSELSLDGAQMGFFTGGGYSDAELGRKPNQSTLTPYDAQKAALQPKFAGQNEPNNTQNLGSINIALASADGTIKSFPVLGSVKTLKDLQEAVNGLMNQYASDGQAAQS